ncbi:hypothetical protein ACVIWU_002619 [Bradyrhizobium sp. USDA 4509]|uniref:Uncharacterized protein n=1 Tax=Bradyrhizobium brasilense TaxID=1419277 RepID=A0A1G7KNK7_9BRAD|nr:hypothetical protein SAMN05216337_105354 [Bradyrhizobium brasilense]
MLVIAPLPPGRRFAKVGLISFFAFRLGRDWEGRRIMLFRLPRWA